MNYTPTPSQNPFLGLYGFKITGEMGTFQVTNIDPVFESPTMQRVLTATYTWLSSIYTDYVFTEPNIAALEIWNQSLMGKPLYVIDVKNELPSISNNWNNYLENNLNSYELGKNLAHLSLQRSEVNLAFGAAQAFAQAAEG